MLIGRVRPTIFFGRDGFPNRPAGWISIIPRFRFSDDLTRFVPCGPAGRKLSPPSWRSHAATVVIPRFNALHPHFFGAGADFAWDSFNVVVGTGSDFPVNAFACSWIQAASGSWPSLTTKRTFRVSGDSFGTAVL